ncbi:MAG: 6-bladed beta-propeller [Muribaculaceae bacterium]|nr:6-bladed beta-propeller [Muribaculaceae bacterium]
MIIDFEDAQPIANHLKTVCNIVFDEDTEEIIGSIQQMTVRGDTIYAVDPAKNPGLYAYLKDGSQLFAYCNMGGGPEDLSSPMNLTVSDTEIVVFDMAGTKLMYFSKDGGFMKSTDLPVFATSAMEDPVKGIWIDYSNQQYEDLKLAWKEDEESDPVPVLGVPDHLKGMTIVELVNLRQLPNGEVRYLPSLEPLIYSLRDGKAVQTYELDYKGKWPSEEEFKTKYSGNDWALKIRNIPMDLKGFSENDRWLVIGNILNRGKTYLTVYDKQTGKSTTYIDSDRSYYNPGYIDGDDLYLIRQDDSIDILHLL